MSPREPSGQHATLASAPYAQVRGEEREVTPLPTAAIRPEVWGTPYREPPTPPAPEQPRDPMWFRVLERYGFPTLVALALGWGFVGYNKQVREDAAKARVEFREVVDRLIKSQEEDRREMRASLTRQTQLLEQIAERLGRDDGRVAARRGGR
jgi:uncharacterized protein HemX